MLDMVSHVLGRTERMNKPQIVYPIANSVLLQAFDNAAVFFPRRIHSNEVSVSCTQDASQCSGALQVTKVIDSKRTSNCVYAMSR